jgi:hypothetical protein
MDPKAVTAPSSVSTRYYRWRTLHVIIAKCQESWDRTAYSSGPTRIYFTAERKKRRSRRAGSRFLKFLHNLPFELS